MIGRSFDFMTGIRQMLFFVLLAFAATAGAEKGYIGGYAGLEGCLKGCKNPSVPGRVKPKGNECADLCNCALLTERAELWTEAKKLPYRYDVCFAKIWPDHFDPPPPPEAPKADGKRDQLHSTPAEQRVVVVCTPRLTDARGNFPPDIRRAMDTGALAEHWARINAAADALKNDRGSALHSAIASSKTVMVYAARYGDSASSLVTPKEPSSANARCPDTHLESRFRFDDWVKKRGLQPKDAERL